MIVVFIFKVKTLQILMRDPQRSGIAPMSKHLVVDDKENPFQQEWTLVAFEKYLRAKQHS